MPPTGDCLDQLEASHDRQAAALRQMQGGARIIHEEAHRAAAVEYGAEEIADALAFWRRAVERHFTDEESSLFPRLTAHRPELAVEIAAIITEHDTHRQLVQRVDENFAHWQSTREPHDAAELAACIEALATAHAQHVQREEPLLVAARRAFTTADLRDTAAEMEARRGRRAPTP